MPDYVEIRKYSGISTFVSKEDRPIEVLQEARNLRFSHKIGRLVKRGGYENILTSGLTALKNMIEFKNKNSERLLMLMDGNTLEESVYSSGYGAIGAIADDERTAGSTIDGTNFFPIIVNKELRSGAGISVSTQRPVWYGYISAQDRFDEPDGTADVDISAGRYLTDQNYKDIVKSTLFADPTANVGIGPNTKSVGGWDKDNGDKAYILISPVIDGYQLGWPEIYWPFDDEDALYNILYDYTWLEIGFKISAANASKLKRMSGFDIFVVQTSGSTRRHKILDTDIAYWVGRVNFTENGDYFLNKTGTLSIASQNITITSATDWHTFALNEVWCYDATNDKYYLIDTDTDSSGSRVLTIRAEGDTIANNGSADLHFFFGWFKATDYYYIFKTDNYYVPVGAEMYAYLGIPKGDIGISDFRYLYSANNGIVSIYAGFPNDKNFSYFSVDGSPDIVPAQNIFRHKADVRGVVSIGKDFLVFTDIGVERITILANGVLDQNDEYLDAVLVHHKAIAKISDNEIAFMSYKGAYIISDRRVIFVGKHLNEWFTGLNAKLTQAQKEACIAHYNDENNELWFSFPTYTDSTYTAGIVHVFDIEAYRGEDLSAWWFLNSDVAFLAFAKNTDLHTLAGSATKIVDMDAYDTDETVSTAHKLKLLQGAIPNRLVRWGWLHLDRYSSSDETITVNLYFDGSATPVVLTLNSDLRGLIAYVKKTLEIEITTPASVKDIEFMGLVLEFQPKQVA